MSKHTPGPWIIQNGTIYGPTPEDGVVARVKFYAEADEEYAQRCFGSFHDLLEALHGLLDAAHGMGGDFDPVFMEALNVADSAIAKARGE